MKKVTHACLLACASALVACASQPPAAPTPTVTGVAPGQTAAAPVAATPVAAAPVVATKVALAPAGAGQTAAPQTAASQTSSADTVEIYGYRRSVVDGKQLYCKTEQVTGSRVQRQEQCFTRAQLEAKQKSAEDYIHQLQQNSGTALHTYAGGTGAP
jgi:hypothetical protein